MLHNIPVGIQSWLREYNIPYAALFDGSTGYLSWTPSSAGDRKTWTFSVWVARSEIDSAQNVFQGTNGTTTSEKVHFNGTEHLEFFDYPGSYDGRKVLTALERDPTAFIHYLIVKDTTDGTAANRIKIYKSGVRETDFDTSVDFALNNEGEINVAQTHYLAAETGSSAFLDGYLAEVNFIDGQALTPSDFGETDATTGNWIAKKYAGSYGTNGFYLDFSNGANLGEDQSGNNNDWTVNGTITQIADNTPTNVKCLLNGTSMGVDMSLSEGNTKVTHTGASSGLVAGAIGLSTKFYFEAEHTTGTTISSGIGVCTGVANHLDNYTQAGDIVRIWRGNATKYTNSGSAAYGATLALNDRVGVLCDPSAGTLEFFKEGVSQGTAWSDLTDELWFPCATDESGSGTHAVKFYFGSDEWTDTPSGVDATHALTTDNLPAQPSTPLSDHWVNYEYTGDGTAIGSGGQPQTVGIEVDFAWIKNASNGAGYAHHLYDSLRGATNHMPSSGTDAEASASEGLTSFDANGFTVGNHNSTGRSGDTYIAWCANLPSDETNSDGDITATWKYNATLGMAAGIYTGTGVNNTIGLPTINGQAPKMWIVKERGNTNDWAVYHEAPSYTDVGFLNLTNAFVSDSGTRWTAAPTSSLIYLGTNSAVNRSGGTYVIYCFWGTDFIKIGSYAGNSNADGPFINTGVSPAFFLGKVYTGGTGNWYMYDNTRSTYNEVDDQLLANTNASETTGSEEIDWSANGVKQRNPDAGLNASGDSYIYLMIGTPNGPIENNAK